MCGFAGFVGEIGGVADILTRMAKVLHHRGPDYQDIWIDQNSKVGLAHARLSILDMSPAGHQPMVSGSGRYVLVFNGEIYNHLILRDEIDKYLVGNKWRGHSDTETLLSGFDAWGIKKTIEKTNGMFAFSVWDQENGMFAFSVWDQENRTLTLGRDRIGEKPLYYGWQGGIFLFGSEIKVLKEYPMFQAEIDRDSLTLMLRYSAIPAPYSIYKGIRKLLPGTLLTLSEKSRAVELNSYWDPHKVILRGIKQPFSGSPDEAVNEFEGLLTNAVSSQMITDVPLGAFLSGGIDSSTIVALMQAQSTQSVHTFTIGYQDEEYNEAESARAVAEYLGTNHTELYVSSQQAMDVIPELPTLYCEPFADASQIPTYLLSKLARQQVTVSLSGDGGDELFAGYNRHVFGLRVWNTLSRFPVSIRGVIAQLITSLSPYSYDRCVNILRRVLPRKLAQKNIGEKLHKLAGVMPASNQLEVYRLLVSHWAEPSELVINGHEPQTIQTDSSILDITDNFIQQMMAIDMMSFLPDDVLVKVDRAAMGVSLETRVPMLDHHVVEYAWSLPLDYKLRKGVSKWPLRQVLYKHVPKELIERPKMGFSIPLHTWLRGPLREWAENLLNETRLRQEGFLNPSLVRKKWDEHLSEKYNRQYQLWNVLMFQAWLEQQ
jgi:asparagine synthase (glutamine-hydrolysing)